jgi:23S rRNA pseudouridine955/2504/2580 synthase
VIQLTVSADAAGQRLDKLVRKALRDVPLSHVYKMFRTRKVRVNGARGKAEQLVAEGDVVVIRGDEERLLAKPTPSGPGGGRPAVTFGVVHEDADVLAVDKPAGLAAHPGTGIEGATLVEMARAYLRTPELPPTEFRPSPAHRLDRETSGVVIVAKHRKAMVRLTEIFTEGEGVQKTYLALVKGKMPREAGTIDLPLAEHEQTSRSKAARGVNFQAAVTRWKVLSSTKEISLLSVAIETGRTHQIRRHLEAVGHPIAGDRRYGDFAWNRLAKTRWGLRRMGLHAWRLTLPHPATGAPLRLEAPLPAELGEVLSRANLHLPPGAAGAARPAGPPRG